MRFIIHHPGKAGEVFLGLPMARLLKEHHPDCEITWVVLDLYRDAIGNCPYVDRVETIPTYSCKSLLDVNQHMSKHRYFVCKNDQFVEEPDGIHIDAYYNYIVRREAFDRYTLDRSPFYIQMFRNVLPFCRGADEVNDWKPPVWVPTDKAIEEATEFERRYGGGGIVIFSPYVSDQSCSHDNRSDFEMDFIFGELRKANLPVVATGTQWDTKELPSWVVDGYAPTLSLGGLFYLIQNRAAVVVSPNSGIGFAAHWLGAPTLMIDNRTNWPKQVETWRGAVSYLDDRALPNERRWPPFMKDAFHAKHLLEVPFEQYEWSGEKFRTAYERIRKAALQYKHTPPSNALTCRAIDLQLSEASTQGTIQQSVLITASEDTSAQTTNWVGDQSDSDEQLRQLIYEEVKRLPTQAPILLPTDDMPVQQKIARQKTTPASVEQTMTKATGSPKKGEQQTSERNGSQNQVTQATRQSENSPSSAQRPNNVTQILEHAPHSTTSEFPPRFFDQWRRISVIGLACAISLGIAPAHPVLLEYRVYFWIFAGGLAILAFGLVAVAKLLKTVRQQVDHLRSRLENQFAEHTKAFTQRSADHEAKLNVLDGKLGYLYSIDQISEIVTKSLPSNSIVLVVSKGDDRLLRMSQQQGWHFPQATDGQYAGHHPADSKDAIGQVEFQREKGANYLLFPNTTFWWFEHYSALKEHLDMKYVRIHKSEYCVIYHLGETSVQCESNYSESSATTNTSQRLGWSEVAAVLTQTFERRLAAIESRLKSQEKQYRYTQTIRQIRDAATQALPRQAKVLVVSKGDEELVRLEGMSALHFPQTEDGVYAGHYPADSAAAIYHLEELRDRGANFLLVPSTAFWWFHHYTEFKKHLDLYYQRVPAPECCMIYRLNLAMGNGQLRRA